MDRPALQELLADIFKRGIVKGATDAVKMIDEIEDEHTIDLREIEKEVRAIKGIGKKRAEEVMIVIEKHLGV